MMTTDQQRAILEAAAKACGLRKDDSPYNGGGGAGNTGFDLLGNLVLDWDDMEVWNSFTNPADCAKMCAKLEINHAHHSDYIQCLWAPQETYHVITMLKDHNNSRLKAWMFAATMVAAKIGGYTE